MEKLLVSRPRYLKEIASTLEVLPVCALIGPHHCGITTVARQFAEQYAAQYQRAVHWFDLEDDRNLDRLATPLSALSDLEGLIVIDGIHRIPNFFEPLRVLVDEHKSRHFLITGNAVPRMLQQTTQNLAGRIAYVEMAPFSLAEIPDMQKLWLRGGFPPSYLAPSDAASEGWRRSYLKTFLAKTFSDFGFLTPPKNVRYFWRNLAHYQGQMFNASEMGRSLGVNYKTGQRYLGILESTFMVRRLEPWWSDTNKRQLQSPRVYIQDSGILHAFWGVQDSQALARHPAVEASWKGFAIEQVIRYHQANIRECYFWGVHGGAELDLVIDKLGDARKLGFKFQYMGRPALTKSVQAASEELGLDALTVITPEGDPFPLSGNVNACSLERYVQGQ